MNSTPKYKRHYTDYCSHMWRFYILNKDNPVLSLREECDVWAYHSCKKVFEQLNREEQRVLEDVYSVDPWSKRMTDIVIQVAQKRICEPNDIWRLLTNTNKAAAKARGLI